MDDELGNRRPALRAPGPARLVPLHSHYGEVDSTTMFWALEHPPEPREGMRAFLKKRAPSWTQSSGSAASVSYDAGGTLAEPAKSV